MSVTFVLGRAGAGKTHYCLSAIRQALTAGDDQHRLILLVPEQASFQMERALATTLPAGGYWRAEVLSFTRLARRVFDEVGAPSPVSSSTRRLALRRLLSTDEATPATADRGGLEVFRSSARTAGFHAAVDRLIEELLREAITPKELAEVAGRLNDAATGRKVRELARLYAAYLSWLGPRRVDSAGRLTALLAHLAGLEWLRQARVWVDGFAGFTTSELHVLVALARQVRELTIALLVDPLAPAIRLAHHAPDPLSLFYRTETTYRRLCTLFAAAQVELRPPIELRPRTLPRFVHAPALATLEAGLAAPLTGDAPATAASVGSSPTSEHGGAVVSIRQCSTHYDELCAAARWIRTLRADSGGRLRYRDFALIARDLESLAPLVEEVFAEYEIPYFLDRRRPLRGHPLGRFLPALLEVLAGDFDVPAVVRLLRTRLLPLKRAQAERLENLIVREQIRGRAAWEQSTWELEQSRRQVAAFAEERRAILAAVQPLTELLSGARGQVWALALYAVLVRLGVRRRIGRWMARARRQRCWDSAEAHRQVWTRLCTLLDELHDVLGDTLLTVMDVQQIIHSAMDELTLGVAPPAIDQVLVASIERSRHPDIKHAWVLAFNEGIFPARPADDLLLSASERELLGAAGLSAPARRHEDVLAERLLAYIALTRPSHSLTISYATVGADGGELLPSPLLADVRRILPDVPVEAERSDAPPCTVAEAAWGYLRQRQNARASETLRRYERLIERLRAEPRLGNQLDWCLRGLRYDNQPRPIGNYRQPADGPVDLVWQASPSEVETYLQCPFKHFARYGLRLEAARGPRPRRWDLGSVAHELLAAVTAQAVAAGGIQAVPTQRWQTLLDTAVADFRRRLPGDYQRRRPDLPLLTEVLVARLSELVRVQAARWQRGRFEPLYCEQQFDPAGHGGTLPALRLQLADGRQVWLRGRIDRVDAALSNGRTLLLVYDYKSSRTHSLRAPYLTSDRLQLLLYLLALDQALGDRSSRGSARTGAAPVQPVGVFLMPLYPDLTALERARAAQEPEQTMLLYRPRGLVTQEAAHLLDRQLGSEWSPVAQLRLKKDGGFDTRSDVVSATELTELLRVAERTVIVAAEGISRGDIAIAPLVEKRTLACRHCDFAAVCRFDAFYNRPRAAEVVLPRAAGTVGQTPEDGAAPDPPTDGSPAAPPAPEGQS